MELLNLIDHDADTTSIDGSPIGLRRVRSGMALYHEGAAVEAIYFVRSGTFKTFKTAEDGYEQVLCFTGRTEVLGFDAVCGGQHPDSAAALEESSVYVLPIAHLFTLAQRFPVLERAVLLAASAQITRRGEIAEVMAAVSADVRLARFLMQLSQRMASYGQSPRRFHLRMGRRDIASHLGLAHETISRSFGALATAGCVRVSNREIEILDLEALRQYARCTRARVDEPGRADRGARSAERAGAAESTGTIRHFLQSPGRRSHAASRTSNTPRAARDAAVP
ncbi:Crp/Fnr family transcriptional regulator [Sphaerotilus hippei]|uniref:Crp/Fnr family transcriptional regulator n=1 Tax=Sphaerotilus hippei TaxID=744406 RepID=UPI0014730645|nr:helix-turn-helix domain-containing protein [Sphaerotilus hippei]